MQQLQRKIRGHEDTIESLTITMHTLEAENSKVQRQMAEYVEEKVFLKIK